MQLCKQNYYYLFKFGPTIFLSQLIDFQKIWYPIPLIAYLAKIDNSDLALNLRRWPSITTFSETKTSLDLVKWTKTVVVKSDNGSNQILNNQIPRLVFSDPDGSTVGCLDMKQNPLIWYCLPSQIIGLGAITSSWVVRNFHHDTFGILGQKVNRRKLL